MKKKLLFIIPIYSHGGTNRSLQFLLSLITPQEFDIYILCLIDRGIYKETFKDYKKVKLSSKLYTFFNSNNLVIKIIRLLDRLTSHTLLKIISKREIQKIESYYKFDKIIGYEEGIATYFTSLFTLKKTAWVHCDYHYYKNKNKRAEKNAYKNIDQIVCVSKHTSKSFKNYYPSLENKITYAYNLLNEKEILILSNKQIMDKRFNNSQFTIISIGRYDPIKQFDRIPDIVEQILNMGKGAAFKWYIIGSGNDEYTKIIETNIQKYQLQDTIILLGSKNNPYPYIKNSNILVSTSLSEACPYVINEAKILNKIVVSTNYESASELIGKDNGIITPLDKMHTILYDLINDINSKYTILNNNASKYNFDTTKDKNRIINIINQ